MITATRRRAPVVAVLAATALTSCSNHPRSAEPTQHSVQALRARQTGPVAVSPVFVDGSDRGVALASMKRLQDPAVPQVLLFDWNGHAWTPGSTVVLDVGGSIAGGDGAVTPIRTADLTPAPEPELVVTVHYNAGPATAILSKYGGRWHALTFSGGLARDGDERFDVTVAGETVTSRENNCVPNCAQGHAVTTTYRFDPAKGGLGAIGSR